MSFSSLFRSYSFHQLEQRAARHFALELAETKLKE